MPFTENDPTNRSSAMSLKSGAFWQAALERAVKTFAQTLAALLVSDGTDLLETAWVARLSISGMAAVVSLLTSIASNQVGDASGPSLANEYTVNPRDGLH